MDDPIELPCDEFDGVDWFVNDPARLPGPGPVTAAYLDCALPVGDLGPLLPGLVEDLGGVLAATTALQTRPALLAHQLGPGVSRPWGPEAVAGFTEALRAGLTGMFLVTLEGPGGEDYWALNGLVVGDGGTGATVQLSLTASPELWSPAAADDVADRILELVGAWSGPLAVLTASVTYDHAQPGSTPWEQWYRVMPGTSALQTRERLRGYAWANLLTDGHVARLGGAEALTGAAARLGLDVGPAAPGSDAVVVRAPGPVTAFDDARLAAMKELLAPALIPARYVIYEGPPLRVVPDPGTAFRRLPPGSPYPRLLAPAHA